NVFVDLRSGGHSFIGSKCAYITSANPLTISNGSLIENATTGSDNDTIIGNALNNTLSSGGGDDRIFAGEGRDTVISGRGADVIDLSEDVQARDTVKFNGESTADGPDIIYGFTQGVSGDCLDLGDLLHLSFDFLPLCVL
ncbi:M10 family metallopeptidase C-terminal domain-containing protein, partial [Planktomarina temperata]|uniref:M10 family metallopeptidase C-terminal domain-containing protein n=1 Tax=Planktomarina temperata TaxID=1284658 RepID=UPI003F6A2EA4